MLKTVIASDEYQFQHGLQEDLCSFSRICYCIIPILQHSILNCLITNDEARALSCITVRNNYLLFLILCQAFNLCILFYKGFLYELQMLVLYRQGFLLDYFISGKNKDVHNFARYFGNFFFCIKPKAKIFAGQLSMNWV